MLTMHLSVDAPDADLFAYLSEVPAVGDPALVTLAAMRLRFRDSMTNPAPLTPNQPFSLTLPTIAIGYRVQAGSRLLVTIASAECGSHENTNTGGSMVDETVTRRAEVTILSGPNQTTRLEVPHI